MANKFSPKHLANIQQSAQQRRLCWIVGMRLQQEQPALFDQLLDEALTVPSSELAKLMFSAIYLRKRRKGIVAERFANSVYDQTSDVGAEEALAKVRKKENT